MTFSCLIGFNEPYVRCAVLITLGSSVPAGIAILVLVILAFYKESLGKRDIVMNDHLCTFRDACLISTELESSRPQGPEGYE